MARSCSAGSGSGLFSSRHAVASSMNSSPRWMARITSGRRTSTPPRTAANRSSRRCATTSAGRRPMARAQPLRLCARRNASSTPVAVRPASASARTLRIPSTCSRYSIRKAASSSASGPMSSVPLAPVLRGEGLGGRGSASGTRRTPSPATPLPLSTGGEGGIIFSCANTPASAASASTGSGGVSPLSPAVAQSSMASATMRTTSAASGPKASSPRWAREKRVSNPCPNVARTSRSQQRAAALRLCARRRASLRSPTRTAARMPSRCSRYSSRKASSSSASRSLTGDTSRRPSAIVGSGRSRSRPRLRVGTWPPPSASPPGGCPSCPASPGRGRSAAGSSRR